MKNKEEAKQWFKIKASADEQRFDVYIEEAIGGWDVSAKVFVQEWRDLPETARVDLHVSSPGGNVFEGMDIYNVIKAHKGTVTAHVGSMAASMSSVIILAADVVKMAPSSMIMIHSPSVTVYGNSEDLLSAAALLDKIESNMLDVYEAHSTKTREEIAAALRAETWLSAKEAVEWGFAHEIEKAEAEDVSASFDLSAYGSVPEQVKESQKRASMTLKELKAKAEQAKEEPKSEPEPTKTDLHKAQKQAAERAAFMRKLDISTI